MTTTESPDTSSGQPPAEAPGNSEIFLGAGQALWLALVTVVAVVALVLALVAVAVVYNDDNSGGSSSASASSGDSGGSTGAAPATSVDLSATEFSFDPDSATVAANRDVELSLVNDGLVQHELVVLNAGVTVSSEADVIDSMIMEQTAILDAGGSDSITVNLQPGTYQFVCLIPGHLDAGMEGTLVAS